MRLSSLRSLLLVLLLVSGQWLDIAHVGKHPALGSADGSSCEYCLHGQGLGAGLQALPEAPVVSWAHELPTLAVCPSVSLAAPAYYPIRGPPSQA